MNDTIHLSERDEKAGEFVFIPKARQARGGKGWRQSKDEMAYEPTMPPLPMETPTGWTGAWVIERLIKAFEADRRLAWARPAGHGSGHPNIIHDDEDKAAWLEQPSSDTAITVRQSQAEIDKMEQAFEWISGKATVFSSAKCLKAYAKCKAYKKSWKAWCERHDVDRKTARRWANDAADEIALLLSMKRVAVS